MAPSSTHPAEPGLIPLIPCLPSPSASPAHLLPPAAAAARRACLQLETGLNSLQHTPFHQFHAALGPATVGTGAASLLRQKLQIPVLLALLNAPLPLAGHSLNIFSPISTAAGGYCGPFCCSCILQRGRHMCKALAGPHFAEHDPKFSIFAAWESTVPGVRPVGPPVGGP